MSKRGWVVIIAGMLVAGCVESTPTIPPTLTITVIPVPTRTRTPKPMDASIDLSYLDEIPDDETLIEYSIIGVGESWNLSDQVPHYVLYADGTVLFRDVMLEPSGIVQDQLSDEEVRELMLKLHQFDRDNIVGFSEEECDCETDGYDERLVIRWDIDRSHVAVAYNGSRPESSKMFDAVNLLYDYKPRDMSYYIPKIAAIDLSYQPMHKEGAVAWPLAPDLLLGDEWYHVLDPEQTALLLDAFETNIGMKEFTIDGEFVWVTLVPFIPNVVIPVP